MAALFEFTDPCSFVSSFRIPDFFAGAARGCEGSPAGFAGEPQEIDLHDYVQLDEGQLMDDHSCLSFVGESEMASPLTAHAAQKGNAGEQWTDGHATINVAELKRRKLEAEYRIGFRTKSEVEIMDDGFKWRKYGKKTVKNSPNPRNYYRCSSAGCGVKKRVERDRNDPSYVLTTYEGMHDHESPEAGHHPFFTYQLANPSPWASCGQIMPNMAPDFT